MAKMTLLNFLCLFFTRAERAEVVMMKYASAFVLGDVLEVNF
jgi:hypothetical protein